MIRTGFFVLLTFLVLFVASLPAVAQQPATPPPEKLAELVRIINDPSVRAWLDAQAKAQPDAATTPQAKPSADALPSGVQAWETHARSNVHALWRALPSLPAVFSAAAGRIRTEAREEGFMPVAAILAIVLVASLLGEWVVRKAIHHAEQNHIVTRTYIELVPLAVFTMIAGAAFFSVDWPPLLRVTILFYLLAAIAFRIIAAVGAMALAAGSLSSFMFRRVLLFSGLLFLALATSALARQLSVPEDANYAAFFLASILLLAVCCEAIWRQPDSQGFRISLLQTLYVLVLWVIWTLGFHVMFWLGLYAVILPRVLPSLDRLTKAFAATRWPGDPEASIPTVLIVRGVRALVVAAAVSWLAVIWEYNIHEPGRTDSWLGLVIPGLIKSVVVLLVADLAWSVAKVLISQKLASVAGDAPLPAEQAAHRARLRTLLPIFRNALAALVLVIAALMVLAELGVEVGPLVAGAGIFGVAIGFGSQTLVKDVISGVFYLMDDAFRVGEYIQSGSYKGTVESFSLRSVRLRHHRGPVFTVPFGELGAVQNLSRDWAIDKFMLRVNFDADISKAKKLVKEIGAELRADEELGPVIIETLKMKGVEQIGEFGIELSFAFTSVPGWQSVIRRRAYVMIRQAFKENGIAFSQPTVHVGGDEKGDAAAAAQTLAEQARRAAAENAAE